MTLTQGERAELTLNLKKLKAELEDIDLNTKRTFRSVILFAIIGIFFFPCLIVAGICYLLYKWGKEKSKELENQISLLDRKLQASSDA